MQNYVFLRSSRCHLFKSGLKNVIRCFMNKLTPFKEKFFFECTICSNKGNFWYKVQNIEKSSEIERPWSDLSESAIKNCFRTKVFGDLTNFCVGIENHKIIFLSWKYTWNHILNIKNERFRSRRSVCTTFYWILTIK